MTAIWSSTNERKLYNHKKWKENMDAIRKIHRKISKNNEEVKNVKK